MALDFTLIRHKLEGVPAGCGASGEDKKEIKITIIIIIKRKQESHSWQLIKEEMSEARWEEKLVKICKYCTVYITH